MPFCDVFAWLSRGTLLLQRQVTGGLPGTTPTPTIWRGASARPWDSDADTITTTRGGRRRENKEVILLAEEVRHPSQGWCSRRGCVRVARNRVGPWLRPFVRVEVVATSHFLLLLPLSLFSSSSACLCHLWPVTRFIPLPSASFLLGPSLGAPCLTVIQVCYARVLFLPYVLLFRFRVGLLWRDARNMLDLSFHCKGGILPEFKRRYRECVNFRWLAPVFSRKSQRTRCRSAIPVLATLGRTPRLVGREVLGSNVV